MAGDNIIRSLFVALGVKVDNDGLDSFEKGLDRIKGAMLDLVEVAAMAATGLAALTAGAVSIAGDTAEAAKQAANMAATLAMSTEEYQRLAYAVEKYGADASDLVDLLGQTADYAIEAANGNKTYAELFERMGIDVEEFIKLSPADQMAALADALASVEDPTERLAIASALLGDDLSKKLTPVLIQGSEGLDRLGDEAERLGLVMSEEAIRAGQEYAQQLVELDGRVESLKQTLGLALIPVLMDVTDRFIAWYDANKTLIDQQIEDWIGQVAEGAVELFDKLKQLDEAVRANFGSWQEFFGVLVEVAGQAGMIWLASKIAAVVMGLMEMAAILAPFLAELWVWITFTWELFLALGSVGETVAVIGGALASALSPIGWIVAAIGALVAVVGSLGLIWQDFYTWLNGGNSVIGEMIDKVAGYAGWLQTIMNIFAAFANLFSAGWSLVLSYINLVGAALGWLGTMLAPVIALAQSFAAVFLEAVYPALSAVGEVIVSIINGLAVMLNSLAAGNNVLAATGSLVAGGLTQQAVSAQGTSSLPYAPVDVAGQQAANKSVSVGGASVSITGVGITEEQAQALINATIEQNARQASAALSGAEV